MAISNDSIESKKNQVSGKALRRLVRIWTLVGIALVVAAAVYLAGILSNAIGVIVWCLVFVFILRGPVEYLDKKGVNRTVGTVLAFLLLIIIVGLLVLVAFSPVFGIREQFADLVNSIPTIVQDYQKWFTDLYNQYADVLQSDELRNWLTGLVSSLGGWLQSLASDSASGLIDAGTSIANTFMCIGFGLVIAFWMLIELPNLHREVLRIVNPSHHDDVEMLTVTSTRIMGGYLRATIVQCALIGVLCGILFTILGIPSSAAIAVITGLLNIIPIVGPWLGGILAFIVGVPSSTITAVVALLGTIVLQQFVYTFVSPKLMGDSVDIHPALTFIALMAGSGIGTAMAGLPGSLVGALLSIPLVAMLKALFVYYFEKRTGRRIVAEDGVFFKGATDEGEEVNPIADASAPMPAVAPGTTGAFPNLSGVLPKIDLDNETGQDDDGGTTGAHGK